MKAVKKEGLPNRARSPMKLLQTQENTPVQTSTSESLRNTNGVLDAARLLDEAKTGIPDLSKRPKMRQSVTPMRDGPMLQTNNSPAATPTKSQAPIYASSQHLKPSLDPASATYDKRMPPPSLDWRGKGGFPSRKANTLPSSLGASQSKTANEMVVTDIGDKIDVETQNPDSPAAKESFVKVEDNQVDFGTAEGTRGEYMRDNTIGITSTGMGEAPAVSTANLARKRSRGEVESPVMNMTKKRTLKSEYCPVIHTSWKPSWLDTTQCYPVDETGEDMSDIECLRGDAIHRSADKLKHILETECMYILNQQVDELMSIARDTYNRLKRTKEFYDNQPSKRIRIERNQFM